MKKFFYRLILIFILIGAGVYWHQEIYTPGELQKICVDNMHDASLGNAYSAVDAQAYCGCLVKTIDADTLAGTAEQMRPCFNTYIQPVVHDYCTKNRGETERSGWNLDCGCFADQLTEEMIEKEKASIGMKSFKSSEIMTKNAFRQCASRR